MNSPITTAFLSYPICSYQRRRCLSVNPQADRHNHFVGCRVFTHTRKPQFSYSLQKYPSDSANVFARKELPPSSPTPGVKRRSRRTPYDIEKDRTRRASFRESSRPLLIASWNGLILAKSSDYEFVDGRFFFPYQSVNWEHMEENGELRYINPIGQGHFYDLVKKSHGESGKVIVRNKCAALSLKKVKRQWNLMQGYTCFWKGVKVNSKL